MAASAPSLALLFVLAACAAGGAFATTHTVGDNGQWTMPSAPNAYTDWASGQTFAVGDDLVFNFQTGAHNVLEVTRSAYDACNIQNPTASYIGGPATVNLTRSGAYYFICGVGVHCSQLNQKMTLTVAAAASTPPNAPSPPPTSGGPAAVPTPTTPSAGTPTSSTGPSAGTGTPRSAAPSGGAGKAAAVAAVGVTAVLAAALLL